MFQVHEANSSTVVHEGMYGPQKAGGARDLIASGAARDLTTRLDHSTESTHLLALLQNKRLLCGRVNRISHWACQCEHMPLCHSSSTLAALCPAYCST